MCELEESQQLGRLERRAERRADAAGGGGAARGHEAHHGATRAQQRERPLRAPTQRDERGGAHRLLLEVGEEGARLLLW